MSSENGWEPARVGPDACEWVTIPGTGVHLQLQKGWPLAVMRAFAADFNAYIEPLHDQDSASWTPTNAVATSNHLNATAMDLNWTLHPFRVKGTFDAAQMKTIRELLSFYEDTIFWAGDWHDPIDEMHWQMGYSTFNNPHTGDFIRRKIRSDGYSTFRRGADVPAAYAVVVLSAAVGISLAKAAEILPMVVNGLRRSQCNTADRIAMWLAQVGHESVSFTATEEFEDGDESTDRWIYKGRTWIQITWRGNYEKFSQWCYDRKLVSHPKYFVDHPRELADLKWAGLGAAWYWVETVRKIWKWPTLNEASDHRDLVTATQIINGGTNGLADRQRRYDLANMQGDQLLTLVQGGGEEGDDMANVPQDQWDWVYNELHKQFPNRSMYAWPDDDGDTMAGRVANGHAFGWDDRVESSALRGEQWAIKLVTQAAAGTDPFLVDHARAVLNEIAARNPVFLQQFIESQGG